MQIRACDRHSCSMKVRLQKQAMAAPSRSLSRSVSGLADPPSPFGSNRGHHPASMPTTPSSSALSSSASFYRVSIKAVDTPAAATPEGKPSSSSGSMWSPRKLMQRAARAFRGSRSRRAKAKADHAAAAAEERASSVTSKVANEPAAAPPASAEVVVVDVAGAANASVQQEEERHDHHQHDEVVPEKIIHEANHQAPPPPPPPPPAVAEAEDECVKTPPSAEKETAAADPEPEPEEESPKKGAAPAPAPAPVAPEAAVVVAEDVADKFVTVVREAVKKHEEQAAEQDEKKEAMRRFQGSRVRTAMEARPESEHPRRRESVRSNDVIEEARSKLLEMRQCSKVRALVGAFETVMEAKTPSAPAAAAAKPQHHYRKSA